MGICTKCLKEPKSSEKSSWCVLCLREKGRKYYNANKEKSKIRSKRWRDENMERHQELCKNRYYKKWDEIRRKSSESKKRPEYKRKEKERRENFREKYAARDLVHWAVRSGKIIKPMLCEICDMKRKLEAHHEDYLNPIELKWVCRICHNQIHGKLLYKNPKEQV